MEKIQICVYQREEIEKDLSSVNQTIDELEGNKLTSFGKYSLDKAKMSKERLERLLATDWKQFALMGGVPVEYCIKKITL